MMNPNYYFIYSKVNITRLFTENIIKIKKIIFISQFFLEKQILENIRKKIIRFGGNVRGPTPDRMLITVFALTYDSDCNYRCHRFVELQRNLNITCL